jgi:hypothetical protein
MFFKWLFDHIQLDMSVLMAAIAWFILVYQSNIERTVLEAIDSNSPLLIKQHITPQ